MAFRDSNIIDEYITAEPKQEEPAPVDYCASCNEPLYQGEDAYTEGEANFCDLYCAIDWHGVSEVAIPKVDYCDCCWTPLLAEYEAYHSHMDNSMFCSIECAMEYYNIREKEI